MINTALTAISVAVVAHVVTVTGVASTGMVISAIAVMTTIGVMLTLIWGAAVSPPGHVIAHRIVCWIGTGIWTIMISQQDWTLGILVLYGIVLAVSTCVIGCIAWIRSPAIAPDKREQVAQREEERRQALIRDDLSEEWKDRIRRVMNTSVTIPAIQDYPHTTPDGRRVGYTLEVHLPAGGTSWRTIHQNRAALENDANLPPGCDITVRMGRTRRVALMDVTTINILEDEQPYPIDYSPLSVHDPLPMMVSRRGEIFGPTLREYNCGIFGEGGSGKSNTGQVIGAGVARMIDAHLCDIDVTGPRLSMPLIRPFLQGRVKAPAVWWVAYNHQEAFLMLRALDRAAIARNKGYNDLKLASGDDKMPISPDFPQFLLRCDEIKHIASVVADPKVFHLLKCITDDHRDPGFRAIMLGLRGTNEIIHQGVQAQLHNIGVLRAQSKAEYVAAFGGQATGIDPQDAPYPGCIQMRLGSAGEIRPYHVWRLVGQQLDDIACAVADYQPGVDALTWLALNGRDQNGRPFADLMPGELDCCATRWTRLRKDLGYESPEDDAEDRTPAQSGLSTTKTVDEAQEEMREAVRRVQEAIARRQEQTREDDQRRSDVEDRIKASDLDGALSDIFGRDMSQTGTDPMAGFRIDQQPAESCDLGQAQAVDTWSLTAEIIQAAGQRGIEMSAIHTELATRGIRVDRATVHKWLKAMTSPTGPYRDQIEWRPDRPEGRNGRWYQIEGK